MSETTQELVGEQVGSEVYKAITPKGFSRPVNTFILTDHNLKLKAREATQFKKQGSRVSIDIFDTSDIRAAIAELKEIELEFERLIDEE
jgi:hypothetical protein